jgi:hypothetical protein
MIRRHYIDYAIALILLPAMPLPLRRHAAFRLA